MSDQWLGDRVTSTPQHDIDVGAPHDDPDLDVLFGMVMVTNLMKATSDMITPVQAMREMNASPGASNPASHSAVSNYEHGTAYAHYASNADAARYRARSDSSEAVQPLTANADASGGLRAALHESSPGREYDQSADYDGNIDPSLIDAAPGSTAPQQYAGGSPVAFSDTNFTFDYPSSTASQIAPVNHDITVNGSRLAIATPSSTVPPRYPHDNECASDPADPYFHNSHPNLVPDAIFASANLETLNSVDCARCGQPHHFLDSCPCTRGSQLMVPVGLERILNAQPTNIGNRVQLRSINIGSNSDGNERARPKKDMVPNDQYWCFEVPAYHIRETHQAQPGVVWRLDRLPDGYRGYDHTRDPVAGEAARTDHFLYGHPSGRRFRVIKDAYIHILWLQVNNPAVECACPLCKLVRIERLSQQRHLVAAPSAMSSGSQSTNLATNPQLQHAQPQGPPQQQGRQYQGFNGFQAAHDHVFGDAYTIVTLDIKNDDWQVVKANSHPFAMQLYYALGHEPGPPDGRLEDGEVEYYVDKQAGKCRKAREAVQNNPTMAEARVMLLVKQVVEVHEHGVTNQLMRKPNSTPEPDLICSARMALVIDAVKCDKYCALDVLAGHNLAEFALGPHKYLKKKRDNCGQNGKRFVQKQEADRVMGRTTPGTDGGSESTTSDTQSETSKKAGKRRATESDIGSASKKVRRA